VRNKEQVTAYLEEIIKNYKIDILINSAGVSAGTLGAPESSEQVEEIFSTNLNGSLNFILPCMQQMIKNRSGTIVMISSMAGMLGLSSAPSYSASKAAIKIFGDALRGYLVQFNVQVCVVIPGYIDTPMTQVNKFLMPFKISASTAAQIIMNGINARKGLIVFPKLTYFMLKLMNLLPYQLVDYINSKLPGKPGFDE
jgi:short-subunit dehydrogenase